MGKLLLSWLNGPPLAIALALWLLVAFLGLLRHGFGEWRKRRRFERAWIEARAITPQSIGADEHGRLPPISREALAWWRNNASNPMPSACTCWACEPVRFGMVLCPKCGNKRCPHANDHHNTCTGSNATGQPGSAYQ